MLRSVMQIDELVFLQNFLLGPKMENCASEHYLFLSTPRCFNLVCEEDTIDNRRRKGQKVEE
jgi:hypothetical protein